jgi:hypothetical protein
VTEPSRLADVDLVVLPGTKSTVSDLGLAAPHGAGRCRPRARPRRPAPCSASAAATRCSGVGSPTRTTSRAGRPTAWAARPGGRVRPRQAPRRPDRARRGGEPVHGYEIHHGRVVRSTDPPLLHGSTGPDAGSDGGACGRHALARPAGERPLPPRPAAPSRGPREPPRVRPRRRHRLRRRALRPAGPARRPRRAAPGTPPPSITSSPTAPPRASPPSTPTSPPVMAGKPRSGRAAVLNVAFLPRGAGGEAAAGWDRSRRRRGGRARRGGPGRVATVTTAPTTLPGFPFSPWSATTTCGSRCC